MFKHFNYIFAKLKAVKAFLDYGDLGQVNIKSHKNFRSERSLAVRA